MLKFICGHSGAGKTSHIFNEILANCAKGKKSFLLVPDQFSMFCEKQLIDMLGMKSQQTVTVLSFSRLTNRILSEAGPLRMNFADSSAKLMLTKRALDISLKHLSILRRAAKNTGFSEVVQKTIAEFKRYGVTSETLTTASLQTKNAELSVKLSDFSRVFDEYEKLLSNGYMDMEDNLSLAAMRLSKCNFLRGATVYIDNFKSFSSVEYDMLREVLKYTENTVVSLTRDDDNDNIVFSSANFTRQKLIDIANEIGVSVADDIMLNAGREFANAELEFLKHNFFAKKPKIYNEITENITLFEPQNHYAEIDEACRQIKRLVAEKNYHYKDICVLYRDFENYEGSLPALFAKYEIPYFCDNSKKCLSNSLIRHAISVMEILAFGFSYERVSCVMKSGFCGLSNRQADLLENYILAADISYRLWKEDAEWKAVPDIPEEFMEEINFAGGVVLAPIYNLIKSISGRKSAREISNAYLEYFKEIQMVERLQSKMESFTVNGQHGKIDEYSLAWKGLNSVIVQISQIFGDEQMTYEAYLLLLSAGLSGLKINVTPPTQDEVLVTQIDRFRSHGAKAVLVLGLNDGVLPKAHTIEGILSDTEREELSELGVTLAETQTRKQIEEQNLIYACLTAPSEQLLLFSPLAKRDGTALAQSFICGRLRRIFPELRVGDVHPGVPQFSNVPPGIATEPMKISKAIAQKLYGEHLWLSISKIEKYNGCAFSYFLQYGLIAKPRATAEFKQNARGSLLHKILSEYFDNIAKNDISYGSIRKSDCEHEIRELTKTTVLADHAVMISLSPSFGYFARRIENVACATAWNIVKFYKQSKFRPLGFEVSFKPAGGDYVSPTVNINGEVAGSLVGSVDRVDVAEVDDKRYITVVDYKSSAKKLDQTLVDAGVQIQPLVYANMLSEALDAEAAALLYMPMSEPIVKCDAQVSAEDVEDGLDKSLKMNGWILDDDNVKLALDESLKFIPTAPSNLYEDLASELDKANRIIKRAAEGMIDGDISISARTIKGFDPCKWCEYASVCEQ